MQLFLYFFEFRRIVIYRLSIIGMNLGVEQENIDIFLSFSQILQSFYLSFAKNSIWISELFPIIFRKFHNVLYYQFFHIVILRNLGNNALVQIFKFNFGQINAMLV